MGSVRFGGIALQSAVLLALSMTFPVSAKPLRPNDFWSPDALELSGGSVLINTDDLTLLVHRDNAVEQYSGQFVSQGAGNPDIAVFPFYAINIPSSTSIKIIGRHPLALLSQSGMTIAAEINLCGGAPGFDAGSLQGGVGGPAGGYSGGTLGSNGLGPGGGGHAASALIYDGGGGGFGGAGGAGQQDSVDGIANGNLLTAMVGGSGGGGALGTPEFLARGGGGAGAIELGANGKLTLLAPIKADGGSSNNGGAGAGGGILLHGASVSLAALSTLSAKGGSSDWSGGGGGGGRIAVAGGSFDVTQFEAQVAALSNCANGGTSLWGSSGSAGVITLVPDMITVDVGQSITIGAYGNQAGPRIEVMPQWLHEQGGIATIAGSVTFPSGTTIGNGVGTLNISDTATFSSGSTLNFVSGTLTIANGKSLIFDGGEGSFTSMYAEVSDGAALQILNGGKVRSSWGPIHIASRPNGTATGTLLVDGPGSMMAQSSNGNSPLWAPSPGNSATITFSNQAIGSFDTNLFIAYYGGAARVNVLSGAALNVSRLIVGSTNASTSAATILINGGALGATNGVDLNYGAVVNYVSGAVAIRSSISMTGTSKLLLTEGCDKVLRVGNLNMSGSSKLDLADNVMIVDYSGTTPITKIRGYILVGRNNGDWLGNGVTSSSAATNSAAAIGYGEASDLLGINGGTFAGQAVDGSAILICHTLKGDANLDGTISSLDFTRLISGYGIATGLALWSRGDFDFNGKVNTLDFNLLAGNFGQTLTIPSTAAKLGAIVPEPLGIPLLVVGVTSTLVSRRRSSCPTKPNLPS